MYDKLIVYVEHIGGGVVAAVMSEMTSQLQGEFCKLAESCKTEKLLSATALSVNQEINKTGISPHGISGFIDSTKLEFHLKASLELLILQNWKFNKTGISPKGISGVTDSTKLEIQQNWNFT